MRLVLIADAFPPMRSSASIQLWDLASEIKRLGHDIWVLVPSSDIAQSSLLENMNGINVLRLRAYKTKDIGYIKRAINEFLLPLLMIKHYRSSQAKDFKWDGVIWYSPTIFLGPIAWYLKKRSGCKAYLILRDIFPKWALDLGLIRKGVVYYFLRTVEAYQYWVADIIGLQSTADMNVFEIWSKAGRRSVEVLNNWLADRSNIGCSIDFDKTPLAGKKVFVYAGNMGVAQDPIKLLNLAIILKNRQDIGFLFVGRGDQKEVLKNRVSILGLQNVMFSDEIPPEEIPALYSLCKIGILSLDERHETSNIPGKFISYVQAGLPVLAYVNEGNQLIEIIRDFGLGMAISGKIKFDEAETNFYINQLLSRKNLSKTCRDFYINHYSPFIAANQIISNFKVKS